MTMTKTQREYLEKRIREIRDDKLKQFDEKLRAAGTPREVSNEDIWELIASKKFKMHPKENIRSTYRPYVTQMVDITPLEKRCEKAQKAYDDYAKALQSRIKRIMDEAVLGATNLSEALDQLESF